ncbi:16S rRNA (guanine(966)-N(2))-methyltransferase RsmD [Pseudoxanthomonas sp. 10H]|uniref:16S rRNA (guanine(966)-N(2))-methyltransferase RsmD n=1 Tax=Pseudoxanthomonas sp. 10H TaxID=3242729 RepID=UPI003556EDEA
MNRPPRQRPSTPARAAGSVRIIGGRWRGTRLPVPDIGGLRPTSDRVRETLFNWLQPELPGARVLDLFAGSGALGLEAVSRGAARAVLVERDAAQASGLRGVAARLHAEGEVQVVQDDAIRWLAGRPAMPDFDIAFLDPPFDAGLWDAAVLGVVPRLAAGGWLYLESPPDRIPAGPPGWTLHRQLRTAQAHAALYRGPGRGGADTLAAADPAP